VFNVHGQLESLGFKQVKKKTTALHGKQIRWQKAFTIPHQWLTPKTQGNFRLAQADANRSAIAKRSTFSTENLLSRTLLSLLSPAQAGE
jgi:hypothetical protein